MSNDGDGFQIFGDPSSASALDAHSLTDNATITPDELKTVLDLGKTFARRMSGAWLLISGRFVSGIGEYSTEYVVRELLRDAFGYPKPGDSPQPINVLLSSPGGHLDSAYSTVLYLSAYTGELNVYVPGRAKSASTLLALGANNLYLSAFGELGPLDTQIPDPRNPAANNVSALDCYQSVDYVRDFGFKTITSVLPRLVESTERRIPVNDLLAVASSYAIGAIKPLLRTITTLDFGGWGRSLRIGERYARNLLRAKEKYSDRGRIDIAHQLVYGYTHHLFPIDINEATRIGLDVTLMVEKTYDEAVDVVNACHGKDFVGFISEKEVTRVQDARAAQSERGGPAPRIEGPSVDLATAEAGVTGSLRSRKNDVEQGGPDGVVRT